MSGETVLCRIRDLPIEVRELMKDRAKRNRRSLNKQLIVDLEGVADQERSLQEAAGEEYAKQQEEGEK